MAEYLLHACVKEPFLDALYITSNHVSEHCVERYMCCVKNRVIYLARFEQGYRPIINTHLTRLKLIQTYT